MQLKISIYTVSRFGGRVESASGPICAAAVVRCDGMTLSGACHVMREKTRSCITEFMQITVIIIIMVLIIIIRRISVVVFLCGWIREEEDVFFVPVQNSACGGSKFEPNVDWIGSARSKRHTHTHPLITHTHTRYRGSFINKTCLQAYLLEVRGQ